MEAAAETNQNNQQERGCFYHIISFDTCCYYTVAINMLIIHQEMQPAAGKNRFEPLPVPASQRSGRQKTVGEMAVCKRKNEFCIFEQEMI